MDDEYRPQFHVWDADCPEERRQWVEAWHRCGQGEVFSHPAYLRDITGPDVRLRAAWGRSASGHEVLYAFQQRHITLDADGFPVRDGLSDIVTALVYGGPLSGDADASATAWFWERFADWARGAGVVSEFIRFSPLATRQIARYPGRLQHQAPHAVAHLVGETPESIVARMSANARRDYRKAINSGLTVVLDESGAAIDTFLSIYRETMHRVGAASGFYFPRELFTTINREFAGRYSYVYVMDGETAVAVNLVLFAERTSYYFLGGTRDSALQSGAPALACVASMQAALARGMDDHVLTGGVTNTPEDSLLEFKRRLVPDGLTPYVTGARVFLPQEYRLLSGDAPERADDGSYFFPAYRRPRNPAGAGTAAVNAAKAMS